MKYPRSTDCTNTDDSNLDIHTTIESQFIHI